MSVSECPCQGVIVTLSECQCKGVIASESGCWVSACESDNVKSVSVRVL